MSTLPSYSTSLAPLSTLLGGVLGNLLAAAIVIILTAIATRLVQLLPSRRLWRPSPDRKLIVCAAQTTQSETGKYVRRATGLGQLRALAIISPSLSRAYGSLNRAEVVLSGAADAYHELNIVSLGTSKHNLVTADILQSLTEFGAPIPHSDGSVIVWPAFPGAQFEAKAHDGKVVKDFGMVIRAKSPFRDDRTVVVLGGASTFGTEAAARYFVENCASVKGDFAAIICAEVRNERVLQPSLVKMLPLPRSARSQ